MEEQTRLREMFECDEHLVMFQLVQMWKVRGLSPDTLVDAAIMTRQRWGHNTMFVLLQCVEEVFHTELVDRLNIDFMSSYLLQHIGIKQLWHQNEPQLQKLQWICEKLVPFIDDSSATFRYGSGDHANLPEVLFHEIQADNNLAVQWMHEHFPVQLHADIVRSKYPGLSFQPNHPSPDVREACFLHLCLRLQEAAMRMYVQQPLVLTTTHPNKVFLAIVDKHACASLDFIQWFANTFAIARTTVVTELCVFGGRHRLKCHSAYDKRLDDVLALEKFPDIVDLAFEFVCTDIVFNPNTVGDWFVNYFRFAANDAVVRKLAATNFINYNAIRKEWLRSRFPNATASDLQPQPNPSKNCGF